MFERASEPLDVVVYFSDERANVERRVPAFVQFLAPGGVLWSAVPERSDEVGAEAVAEIGRAAGAVPNGTLPIAPGWIATRLERPAP